MANYNIAHAASYLVFTLGGKNNPPSFTVLCGDDPPTIIDGYAIWQVLSRPLRQGIAIPQGFNPAKLQMNVRFGEWRGRYAVPSGPYAGKAIQGWDTSDAAAQGIEGDINLLHSFAGGNALGGPSPVIYVDSFKVVKGQTVESDLIPRQYHKIPWIIDSGITWGVSLRNSSGSRIYQEAAFTITGYASALGGNPPAPRTSGGTSGGYFKTKASVRTARQIAAARSTKAAVPVVESLARSILAAQNNNPIHNHRPKIDMQRRSIDWKIPIGVDIWVPSHTSLL